MIVRLDAQPMIVRLDAQTINADSSSDYSSRLYTRRII